MNRTTAHNHCDRFLRMIDDAYYWARFCGHSHDELIRRKRQVYDDPAWLKCPAWVREQVSIRAKYLFDALYTPALSAREYEYNIQCARAGEAVQPAAYLRWQLFLDGEPVTSDDIIRRRENGDETVWDRVDGAHVWNHKPDNRFS